MDKSKESKDIKITLSGSGSGGPVAPLLAVYDYMVSAGYSRENFLWVGTKKGLEKEMVANKRIKYRAILSGKLRRYFSFKNFIDPFKIIIAFFQSLVIVIRQKPGIVISAGGFVSVPLVWAAWVLRVPVMIHQQDIRPGLANKVMAPMAKKITVAYKKSLNDYKKAVWVSNPVRSEFKKRYKKQVSLEMRKCFGVFNDKPVLLVLGGGTGAAAINELVSKSLDRLLEFCQVIHVGGKGKTEDVLERPGYYFSEFLKADEMADAMQIADLVISRCGIGTLTELSYLEKPSILIPMPNSHQEDNARHFKKNDAAIHLSETELNEHNFAGYIKNYLNNKKLLQKLSNNIGIMVDRDSADSIAREIEDSMKIR